VRAQAAEDGHARLEFKAEHHHLNPAGTVHGGVLATLVDTAMGMAARSRTDDGEVPATSQLTIAYLTAASEGPNGRDRAGAQARRARAALRR
jgi:uncharacterized protein (TIGR00369 family)